MTIITGRQFRANQSKYIEMAQRGERVILSSRVGYAELTPLSKEDKDFHEYVNSEEFQELAAEARQDYLNGRTTRCASLEELHDFFESL